MSDLNSFVFKFLLIPLLRNRLFIWDKVFKSGPSKIFGRQPVKNLKWQTISLKIL